MNNYNIINLDQVSDYYPNILNLITRNQDQIFRKFLHDNNFTTIETNVLVNNYLDNLMKKDDLIKKGIIDDKECIKGAIFFGRSEWDSMIFGIDIGKVNSFVIDKDVNLCTRRQLINASLSEAKNKGLRVLFLRLPLSELKSIQAFECEKAYLTDILFTYYQNIEEMKTFNFNSKFDVASLEDEVELVKLASDLFTLDHFHADPMLNANKSNELYKEWIVNSCRGLVDIVLLTRKKSKIIGFITCRVDKYLDSYSYGLIDLIGVSKEWQGVGVGDQLVKKSLNWFKERTHSVYVGTQARNIGAIRLYEKNKFTLMEIEATLHRWL